MLKESFSSVRIFYPPYDKDGLIKMIKGKLNILDEKFPLLLVVLFGSYAKGNYTVASDIDLLIVYSGVERNDAFAIAKKIIAIPGLEPHLYSEAQYEELKQNIHKMVEDGVILLEKEMKVEVR